MLPRCSSIALVGACLLLQACGTMPTDPQAGNSDPSAAQDITLNLPTQDCQCDLPPDQLDTTFLERGFQALGQGDHIEALQNFQRYARLEKSTQAEWESEVSIAFLSILPSSPLYAPDEARKTYRDLRKERVEDWQIDQQVALVAETMDMFLEERRYSRELEEQVTTLEEDLEKKEEALKRLRDLTLGQRGPQR